MNDVVMSVSLVVIAGFVGYLSTYYLWNKKVEYRKKNIARGFFMEILSMEKELKSYAGLMSDKKEIYGHIYTNYGLFFTFRKEILELNSDLSKRFFRFYIYLLKAEKYRTFYNYLVKIQKKGEKSHIDEKLYEQVNDEMRDCITKALELLPEIKELEKEYS